MSHRTGLLVERRVLLITSSASKVARRATVACIIQTLLRNKCLHSGAHAVPAPPLTLYFCTQSMTRSAPRVVMPALAPWPSTSTTMAYCGRRAAVSGKRGFGGSFTY